MNAWIDCMDIEGPPKAGSPIADHAEIVTLELPNATAFRDRCPERFDGLVECAAFVNWRNRDRRRPRIALAFLE